jgi:hypothetical protein
VLLLSTFFLVTGNSTSGISATALVVLVLASQ